MKKAPKITKRILDKLMTTPSFWASYVPLLIDTPGIFYVEACKRIDRGAKSLKKLVEEMKSIQAQVAATVATKEDETAEDAFADLMRGIGNQETLFGNTVRDLAVADILLVAAAESYLNAIAEDVMTGAEFTHFDQLSPVGKWLFLPQVLKLKWRPSLSEGCLQQFAATVARRNRFVHPKTIKVSGTIKVHEFIALMRLDAKASNAGATAVKELIQGISMAMRGSYGPDWLDRRSAARRPPCFIIGTPQTPGRLGRGKAKGHRLANPGKPPSR